MFYVPCPLVVISNEMRRVAFLRNELPVFVRL